MTSFNNLINYILSYFYNKKILTNQTTKIIDYDNKLTSSGPPYGDLTY